MWTLCCHRSLLNPLCPPFQPPSPLTPSSLSDCREGKYLRITLSLWLFFFPFSWRQLLLGGLMVRYRERGTKFVTLQLQTAGPSCLECYESRSQAREQRGEQAGEQAGSVVFHHSRVEWGGRGRGWERPGPAMLVWRERRGPSCPWFILHLDPHNVKQ